MSTKTPNSQCLQRKGRSSNVGDSVKRNLNRSFSECKDLKTTNNDDKKSDLTIVINKKTKTCRYKHYYYESVSESDGEDDPKKLIITGKRRIKSPLKYSDYEYAPKSPRKHGYESGTTTPNKSDGVNRTPRTPRTPKLLKNKLLQNDNLLQTTPKTNSPKNRLRLIKNGAITPSMPMRETLLTPNNTPLSKTRNRLHVSYVPKQLPCREKEYGEILNFLKTKLFDNCGGCMYISGVPGTGKTATVNAVINHLLEIIRIDECSLRKFEFVSINGMKLTEPRQAYVEILKQLSGKTIAWEQAQNILNDRFTKKTKQPKSPVILLIDELDIICTRRQDVVYNLLDWPTKANNQLIVITIANTMDLPERLLMNRVTSRLGLTRLTFQAYTYKQLQEIVSRRLIDLNSFNSDAIQLVSRKVASVSGDARRALDICRRAAEIAESESPHTLVTIKHVDQALKMMITQPKVQAIKHCTTIEKYLLQAVVAEMERTGIEETNFCDIYRTFLSLLTLNGIKTVTITVALMTIARLSSSRLLLVDTKCNDLDQRIILNVSSDDVYYALKEEKIKF